MSERLSKKQLQEDPFMDAIQAALRFARDNVPIVIAGAVVFVGAVVLAVRVGGSAAGRPSGGNPAAERALTDARSEFALGRMDEGVVALDNVRSSHRGSRAAREATYVLGSAYFEQGNWDAALTAFQEFLNKPLYDGLMKDGARIAIASCKEEMGDLSGAHAAFREVWDTGSHPGSRIQGAFSAARCARLQGQAAEAERLYQAILDQYPEAPEAEDARFELLALKG